jgi:hypothetical protein
MPPRTGCGRKDNHPVQAEVGRARDDHPDDRVQRRDRRVPELIYHRLGCRRSRTY